MAPKLRVLDVSVTTRPIGLRLPFRYGVVTLREAREAQLSVRTQLDDGTESTGHAAELLAPKWFDKSPELSNDDNVDQLLSSIDLAASAYRGQDGYHTAFGLHAACDHDHRERCSKEGLNGLVAGFGSALLDKAILAALCSALDRPFHQLISGNAVGLTSATADDMKCFDFPAFLASLKPSPSILARHTVGLVDAIFEEDIDVSTRVDDGLPESLEAAIKDWGLRAFKIKVGGNQASDLEQLARIASLIDRIPDPYLCTLDGNEQYQDASAFAAFHRAMLADHRLTRLVSSIHMIEQPIARSEALCEPLGQLGADIPIEIDESDSSMDAFLQARSLGYRGVSSKSCKGVYRALINRARVAKWNALEGANRYFISAEDLSTQPGLAVQQDLSLVALLGCSHVERNGHFYGDGQTGLPGSQHEALKHDLPGLYRRTQGKLHLDIKDGAVDLTSLQRRRAYSR